MFFDEFSLGVIAIAAGILILAGWVHQIIKGYQTKRLKDVSKLLVILIAVGAFLWLVYGVEVEDPYIIGVNVAAIALTMIVLGMKIKYEKLK